MTPSPERFPRVAPFEYLVGQWNGNAMPKDNPAKQFRGWPEKHTWAWFFDQGKPAGLKVTIEGGKILATGKLTYDPARRHYRLEGIEPKPRGGPIAFEGALEETGRILVLERVAVAGVPTKKPGRMRLSLRPNANFVRYTMTQDLQDPDAVQFTRMIEVGLTKEGESFAAGAVAAERPKCIVTGGTATMTTNFQGRSIPLCCTGCLDEFNGDPEKYLKKAALMLSARAGKAKAGGPAASRVSRSEDAFAGDVVDDATQPPPSKQKKETTSSNAKAGKSTTSDEPAASLEKPKSRPDGKKNGDRPKSAAANPATRAATLLAPARNLEKSGKTSGRSPTSGRSSRIIRTPRPPRPPPNGSRPSRKSDASTQSFAPLRLRPAGAAVLTRARSSQSLPGQPHRW